MTTPSTSIVILTRDELACTRQCVEGIQRVTTEPFELVFVDNGSTDGTLEYLRSIEAATVIENGRNLGFGAGCNQGIAASAGDRILLLNNDVVPTTGWLGALHAALDADGSAGIVGPRTNRIAGVQRVEQVDYDQETLVGLEEWAATWVAAHRGQRSAIPRLVGFCLLLERRVVERIGGFDLRYGLGNFEDDDLCLRAGVAGFDCRIVHDSFVHHFGSRTFVGQGIDYSATIAENYVRFAQAWQLTDEEVDPGSYGYPADRLIASTAFDPARHHAPLVAHPDRHERIELAGRRSRVVAVCCDRLDSASTRRALEATLAAFGPGDDVTVVVRIDPRDDVSTSLLDGAADLVGDDALPDVAVVTASDEDDRPVLRSADLVVVPDGRMGPARRLLAEHLDVAWTTSGSLLDQ